MDTKVGDIQRLKAEMIQVRYQIGIEIALEHTCITIVDIF